MAKPNWNRRLSEVLQQDTRKVALMGNKGKEYQTEVVPVLEVVSTGSIEEVFKDGVSDGFKLSLIHISEPTRRLRGSRMPSSA